MLRTTAFPLTRNPAGMRFIPPVTNGLVCICVCLLRVRGSFLDQSCNFFRLGNINSDSARVESLATVRNPPPTFLPQLDHARYSLPPSLSRATSCLPPPPYGPP